ncbi:hypothetical protein J5N97_028170 [Dioscorea zingiberensis]|uniref:Membrane protein YuiD n=1 Tax=Dioscorea zingiberensis TaxID=325984 RepID=A0A9D5H4L3_9LILI|nr:hypothetical protein J5N97_028170 [Dioscorea zingiberensis]
MSCSYSTSLPRSLLRTSTLRPSLSLFSKQRLSKPNRLVAPVSALRIGVDDLMEVVHNKVLVAATVSAAIGQLAKPLVKAANGDGLDLRAAVRSGGMPSTHSSSVVAAATSIGLERGFSDSIFGMSVVFAALIMYDAQGVRREVGNHAKILNRLLKIYEKSIVYHKQDGPGDSRPGMTTINSKTLAPFMSLSEKATSNTSSDSESYAASQRGSISSKLDSLQNLTVDGEEPSEQQNCIYYRPLNESVGHTEIQVFVGALLGFVVSLVTEVIL